MKPKYVRADQAMAVHNSQITDAEQVPVSSVWYELDGFDYANYEGVISVLQPHIVGLAAKRKPLFEFPAMIDPIPSPAPTPKKRCTIYLDAFNWNFGIFMHRPAWKWLNLQSFFEALWLDEEVVAIKFFTALVTPTHHQSEFCDGKDFSYPAVQKFGIGSMSC